VKSSSVRRAVLPAVAILTAGLALTGCGDGNTAVAGGAGAGTGGGGGGATLTGGGSTAQAVAQDAWRAAYQKAHSGTSITYEQVGSGTGVDNFTSGSYAFAGTDAYLDAAGMAAAKKRCGADAIEVPDYVSPIAIAYKLQGVSRLNLSADVIADIFNGTITSWDDARIAAENKGAKLPSTTITPLHRSDGSGTTWNFTDYLSQAAQGRWSSPADENWPTSIKVGQGFAGTSGVVGALQQTEGAVAYVDNSAVPSGVAAASIKVGGSYNAPSAVGAAKVVDASGPIKGRPAGDIALDIARTSTAAGAYPLLLTSYLVACPSYADSAQAGLVKDYLRYVLSAAGQQVGSQAAKSAPLPSPLARQANRIVGSIH
jgi:phosphate transport system substrate-binding protein